MAREAAEEKGDHSNWYFSITTCHLSPNAVGSFFKRCQHLDLKLGGKGNEIEVLLNSGSPPLKGEPSHRLIPHQIEKRFLRF